ncbi:MAG: uroporphyrinogen-III C-methyltransferase [Syntrophorhabdales bacterium]|jgi:uroporphyrinogen III methyltransferase/synthase
MQEGKVYLVGAGPGDVGLLTLKGLRCLRRADVIVYDFHINPQILNYVRPDAEFVYAGKRGGHHEMSQDEINRVLVERARGGRRVCRLKGGDPFVFGRGGEEAEVLSAAGIAFEVVPGVSSAIAAAAYAGIPLTHRRYASSFAVITGSEAGTDRAGSAYWSGLADAAGTLVFLMGVKNIEDIAGRLIGHGKSPDTPAALIRWGTRPEQRTIVAPLGEIAGAVREGAIRPPAILVVGEVVRLREALKWYEAKPLFGQRVLITRGYTADYEPLEDLGAEVFEFPTVRIAPPASFSGLDRAIGQLSTYDWLVVTSPNTFSRFLERLMDLGLDVRDLGRMKICAIGSGSAETLRRAGLRVDLVPDEFSAEGLTDAFCSRAGGERGLHGMSLLLPRAEKGRDLFPEKVRALGGRIDTPAVYRAIKPEKHGRRLMRFMSEGRISIATFTSGATFTNFLDIAGKDGVSLLQDVAIAVIGPVTRRAVEAAGLKVAIMPQRATIPAMVAEIARWAAITGHPLR